GRARRTALFKRDVAPLRPSHLPQSAWDCRDPFFHFWLFLGRPYHPPTPPHRLALLRAHSDRPCRWRAAEQSEEVAPPHGACPCCRDSGQPHTITFGRHLLCVTGKLARQTTLWVIHVGPPRPRPRAMSASPPRVHKHRHRSETTFRAKADAAMQPAIQSPRRRGRGNTTSASQRSATIARNAVSRSLRSRVGRTREA